MPLQMTCLFSTCMYAGGRVLCASWPREAPEVEQSCDRIPRAPSLEGSCSSRRESILCCCFFLFLADLQWKFFQCSGNEHVINSVGRERNQLRASCDLALAGLQNAKAASALLSKHT